MVKKQTKTELDYIRILGEKKVKSLQAAYELTEGELALILKLHSKRNKTNHRFIKNLLQK